MLLSRFCCWGCSDELDIVDICARKKKAIKKGSKSKDWLIKEKDESGKIDLKREYLGKKREWQWDTERARNRGLLPVMLWQKKR